MNRKILIYIGLIIIIWLLFKYQKSEEFSNQTPNKIKILITGLRAQLIAQFIANKLTDSNYELVVHIGKKEPEISNSIPVIFGPIDNKKDIANTVELLAKSGPYDIIIHNLHDPKLVSGSILNINNNINIKLQMEFINSLVGIVNPSGKIVSFITDLEEFSDSKTLDYSMGNFIKSQSIENYKNSIGFTTIKFPELSSNSEQLSSVLDWVLSNNWDILTGREFYSNHIYNKTPGYSFGLEQTIESNLESNFKNLPNPHANYYQALKSQLAKTNNVELNNIYLFSSVKIFLTNIINKFVPAKHHIILFNLPDHNFIPIDRAVSTDTWKIQNKQLVPDYKKILEKLNSLTRLIYLSGFINQNEFAKFIKQIPNNILVVIDLTWINFTKQSDKSQFNNFKII